MRYILTILLITTLTNLNAQVPDFTLTDIGGTTHNLYSYLEQGKTVVLNFSTTDCNECWGFHETQNINTANTLYGASGTDEMVFLFLETKNTTGISELEGNGLNTNGDWVTGTNYPIIDGAEDVAANYGITNVPAVIAVCADTSSTDLYTSGYPKITDMYIAHKLCTPPTNSEDLTIIEAPATMFCNTLSPRLTVVNTGTDTIGTASFQFSTDTETDTVSWSGMLAPGEHINLTLNTLISATISVTTTTISINGTPYNGSSLTTDTEQTEPHCVERITITILTDGYGCETRWDLIDSSGDRVLPGGNEDATAGNRAIAYDDQTGECTAAGYDSNASFVVTYPSSGEVLATDCYRFHIFDDWGDGMCCGYGEGSYTITDQDGNELASGGEFGAEEIITLNLKTAVSGGIVNSGDTLKTLCENDNFVLQSVGGIFDLPRGFNKVLWGTWILADPLNQTTTPAGPIPTDQSIDDANYAGILRDNAGEVIAGDSITIYSDTSGITYYISPFISNSANEFDNDCTGLNPSQGYSVFMNPNSDCASLVSIEHPILDKNINISPNPAQDHINISFGLDQASEISIALYNIVGQQVKYLQNSIYSVGQNNIEMDTRDLPSGIYFITLQTKAGNLSKRITIAKP